jgi:hypothetical protein
MDCREAVHKKSLWGNENQKSAPEKKERRNGRRWYFREFECDVAAGFCDRKITSSNFGIEVAFATDLVDTSRSHFDPDWRCLARE